MKPATIKKLDYYIGIPLCFLLTLYEKGKSLFSVSAGQRDTNRIVFIKLVEQGATVIAYPAIRRAIEMVGRENVFFCVFKENRPILDILNVIPEENIFEIRKDNLPVFIYDILQFFLRARRLKIDTAIDMEFFSRSSAIISYLTGAAKIIGYHRYNSELPYRGDLMTHKLQFNPYIHIAYAYRLLVESVLLSPNEQPMAKIKYDDLPLSYPLFVPSDGQIERVNALLKMGDKGHDERPYIIINPNASDMLPLRKWDMEKFIILAERLLKHYDKITLIITGSPSEISAADELCKRANSNKIINIAGKTSLEDLLTLYYISDVIVTNDSGPGHFASLTSIHNIVLFGPETPRLFGPKGKNVHVIYKKLACSPCVNAFNHRFSPCANNICMKHISVDEVFYKIRDVLMVGAVGIEPATSSI